MGYTGYSSYTRIKKAYGPVIHLCHSLSIYVILLKDGGLTRHSEYFTIREEIMGEKNIKSRNDIDSKYKWKIELMYPDRKSWDEDVDAAMNMTESLFFISEFLFLKAFADVTEEFLTGIMKLTLILQTIQMKCFACMPARTVPIL